MSAKKSAAKSAARKSGRAFAKGDDPRRGAGPKKGAPNAGRPPSEVKRALLEGFADLMPELFRIAREGATEGDRIRAMDIAAKYAGLQSIDIEVTRPSTLVITGLE